MCRHAPLRLQDHAEESDDDVDYETEEEEEEEEERYYRKRRPSTRFYSLSGTLKISGDTSSSSLGSSECDPSSSSEEEERKIFDSRELDDEYFGKPVSALTQQLKALFLSIKMAGLMTCRDSELHEKSQEGCCVLDEAKKLQRLQRRGCDIGWANEVALARYKALESMNSSSGEFILCADLAASLRTNGVKMPMAEVQELWNLLVPKSSLNFYTPRLNFVFSDSRVVGLKLIILVETKKF